MTDTTTKGTNTVEAYLFYEGKYAGGPGKIILLTGVKREISGALTGRYYIRFDVNKPGETRKFWDVSIIEGTAPVTGSMGDSVFAYGELEKLSGNSFTREGYTFAGWGTEPGGEVKFQNEEEIQKVMEPGQEITLYAIWTKNP